MKDFIWLGIFLLLLTFILLDHYVYHPQLDLAVKVNEIDCVLDSLKQAEKYNHINTEWNSEWIREIEAGGYHRNFWKFGFTERTRKIDHKFMRRKGLLGFYNETRGDKEREREKNTL